MLLKLSEGKGVAQNVIVINSGAGSFSGGTGKPMTDREYRNELLENEEE